MGRRQNIKCVRKGRTIVTVCNIAVGHRILNEIEPHGKSIHQPVISDDSSLSARIPLTYVTRTASGSLCDNLSIDSIIEYSRAGRDATRGGRQSPGSRLRRRLRRS